MNKSKKEKQPIALSSLLHDPLLKTYLPQGLYKGILENNLLDKSLEQLDIPDLSEISEEELAAFIFEHGVDVPSSLSAMEDENGKNSIGNDESTKEADSALLQNPISVTVSGVGEEAKVVLHNMPDAQAKITKEAILDAIRAYGIKSGIRYDFVERLAGRPVYERSFKIAQGKLPVHGEDGRAVFHFDTSFTLAPKISEDGSADYKSLDFAQNVKKDDLLCELIPPTKGEDGISVFGDVLTGKMGKPVDIMSGANTYLSEDHTKIYAACDGHVNLRNNRVNISRVMTVDQVGPKTGNILFVGSVLVTGDVLDGYTVRAGGDITVKGIVENASLIAGGNITLFNGMKGQTSGLLDAGGSIRTLFLENTKAKAGANIYANVILNSEVTAGEEVSITGANGCLLGGTCTAGKTVRAYQIGNQANIKTTIYMEDVRKNSAQEAKQRLHLESCRETLDKLYGIAELAAGNGTKDVNTQIVLARVVILKQRLEKEIKDIEAQLNQDTASDKGAAGGSWLYTTPYIPTRLSCRRGNFFKTKKHSISARSYARRMKCG